MSRYAAFVVLFLTGAAHALGLGQLEGRAVIGRPLALSIPILGFEDDPGQTACATFQTEGDDGHVDGIRIKVERGRVHLSSSRYLTQPILRFRVRLGCTGPVERSYLLLPDPATAEATALPTGKGASDPVGIAPESAGKTAPPLVRPLPIANPRSIVLMSSTSLRMLSRQRYPGDSSVRVSFIRQVAAANPDLFASEEVAFDQQLAAGTRIVLPPGVPSPRRASMSSGTEDHVGTKQTGASPRTPSGSTVNDEAKRKPVASGGRLIVGGAALSAAKGPSATELNESIDRLADAMNQQVMVQIALTERIKSVEAELADLKRWAKVEKARASQMEAELKTVKEAAERSGTIQLLLAVVMAGLAAAGTMIWQSRRRVAPTERQMQADVPTPSSVSATRSRSMPSAFDDLLDPRDDILPPGGSR